jgi:hypothetical protein
MAALVVGGLLMAMLVALAGSVQQSYGQTKGITELQSNLRFAMRTMVEDFHRVNFQYTPDPELDPYRFGPSLSTVGSSPNAIVYDNTAGAEALILRGNFVSSRDYRFAINVNNTIQVLCRNGMEFINNPSTDMPACGFSSDADGYDPYLEPFADGPESVHRHARDVDQSGHQRPVPDSRRRHARSLRILRNGPLGVGARGGRLPGKTGRGPGRILAATR